jgi:choloylglycine hydrolase
MKKILYPFISILFLSTAFTGIGAACTTFVLKNNDSQLFGRNYDWGLGDALLMVNKRGCRKTGLSNAAETGNRAIWTATFGSVTFNQYGRGLPTGGMNEVGLVVETMALSEARYPEPDHRPYLGSALQWRQYLLDTCATVDDVIDADHKVRISDKVKGIGMHVLVLDKAGDCAVIEFLSGRMTVYRGPDLPVAALTNDTYARSLRYFCQGRAPLLDTYNSINRFIKAATQVQHCSTVTGDELLAYAFDTLAGVASGRTQWRIVYDNRAMVIHYRTRANFRLRHVDLFGCDFSAAASVKVLDVDAGPSGNVGNLFGEYTYEANRDLIGRAFGKTGFLSGTPDERLDAIARFPERFLCQ